MRLLIDIFCSLIDDLLFFLNQEKACIHDMAPGTRVVEWRQ